MKSLKSFAFALLAWLVLAGGAHAASTCTVSSATVGSVTYANAAITTTGTVNWSCTRQSNGADGTVSVIVTAGQGNNFSSGRRATNGANTLGYSLLLSDSKCATASGNWGNGTFGTGCSFTAITGGGANTASGFFNFTFSMAASLNPTTGLTYADNIAVSPTCTNSKAGSACTPTGATLAISIVSPPSCRVASGLGLGSLVVNYTAFQASPGLGNAPFAANCANGLAYSMALGSTGGTLAGLPYTLTIGSAANTTTDISNQTLTGTGGNVNYYVNARIAPSLPGTCTSASCTATSAAITLTITY